MNRFCRRFIKVLAEDMTAGDTVGSSEGLAGGQVGNEDSYATGDQRIPKSIFGGIIKRDGITKCKKCKKGKKCEECKKEEDEEEEIK